MVNQNNHTSNAIKMQTVYELTKIAATEMELDNPDKAAEALEAALMIVNSLLHDDDPA